MDDRKRRIGGWVLAALAFAGAFPAGAAKIFGAPPVVESFTRYGLLDHLAPLGVVEMIVALLVLFPRTSSLGALLMTGFYGGAISMHLAHGEGAQVAAPMIIAALSWGAAYLRNPRLFGDLAGPARV